ncbi:FAD-binding oxidoreductase [Spongorhabdus nitratireducens]
MAPRAQYPVTLVSRQQLTKSTFQLNFELDPDLLDFVPGQFIQLLFEFEGEQCKRSYSVANSPENFRQTGQLQIALACVEDGKASQCFAAASPGDTFNLSGPFGMLVLPEDFPRRIILAGTGTGVAPYRAMLPSLQKKLDDGIHLSILMGARHRRDLFYEEDFQHVADSYEHASFIRCLSRESNISAGEHHGYVQSYFEQLGLNPTRDLIYLCGTPGMIDDAVNLLQEAGFGARQVKREKYVFSGH